MTGARKALIVAIDRYEHEGLRRLRSPQADAAALAAVLSNPQIGAFDVRVVRNEPSHEVQAQIEDLFADSRPEDLLLLHFACHGVKNDAGELYFAALNTRLDRLASTAVSADFVQRGMRSSRSRSIVLLLDCCYGGAFGRGVSVRAAGPVNVLDSFPSGALDGGRGRAVITASSSMEYAFEGDTLADDHSATSVFTDALVRGLSTGEADRDEDGWISLNELYDYVFDRVRTTTPGQTPTRDVEMQGELYLARSRRRRVKAAPVPPDLLAASNDANVFTRLGAVSELRARLLGDNVPAAAGAYNRLTEIADGDIRYVADAASAALAEASLGVTRTELSFGDVPHGAEPPHLAVGLRGPPFARTCSYETSDVRIGAQETADGFDVTVDTSQVGTVDGVVTVTGPTGEGRVAVRAVVTAPAQEPAQATATSPAPAEPERRAEPAVVLGPGPLVDAPVAAAEPAATPGVAVPGGHDAPARRTGIGSRWAVVAAGTAAVGAALLAVGGASPFQWGSTLRDHGQPEHFYHAPVLAFLVAVSAVLLLVPRTRLPAGAGVFLAVVASSTWGLWTLGTAWWNVLGPDGGSERGFWLMLAGHVVVLLAGAVVARALVLREADRRPQATVGRRLGPGWVRRPVVVTGLLGAAALVVKAADPVESGWDWTMSAWLAVLAAGVPLAGALTWPARVGRWLLVGWVVGGGTVLAAYLAHHARLQTDSPSSGTAAVTAFGLTLVLLLTLVVVDAWRDRRRAVGAAT